MAGPLGFALGFVIGLTGVGGGALVAPALYLILGVGYAEAVALSLVYAVLTKIIGAAQHIRQGTVIWRVTLWFGLAGIPGAVLGSRLVYVASPSVQATFPFIMGGILVLVAFLMLVESEVAAVGSREKPFSPRKISRSCALTIVAIQAVVGIVLGLSSVGSGCLVILAMAYLFKMSAQEIVGSNIVISLIMSVPAGATHYLDGYVDVILLALLLVGSFVGAVLGSKSAMVMSGRALKLAITALLLVAGLATLSKAWTTTRQVAHAPAVPTIGATR
ncbi:MAG: sulfite exporter TauE/SafE family protein [Acidobacteria bacterium]|nr:sulfite exporter TauE/SafE family protein [Acidobacteriota bacterium]